MNEFKNENNEFDELILPNEFKEVCYGCANCILKGENKCAPFNSVDPIIERIEKVDLIIISIPIFVMSCSSELKALLDHLAYIWLLHRPKESIFKKSCSDYYFSRWIGS